MARLFLHISSIPTKRYTGSYLAYLPCYFTHSPQPYHHLPLRAKHARPFTMTISGRPTTIHRTTMFKLPDPENQKNLVEAYKVLETEQQKDGKPYILRLSAGIAIQDPRSKEYTVVAQAEFASLEDMRYYDNECPAHGALKKKASTMGITEPPLAIYFESQN